MPELDIDILLLLCGLCYCWPISRARCAM